MLQSTSNQEVILVTGAKGAWERAVTNALLKAAAMVFGVSHSWAWSETECISAGFERA
jgi:hypothetical protein